MELTDLLTKVMSVAAVTGKGSTHPVVSRSLEGTGSKETGKDELKGKDVLEQTTSTLLLVKNDQGELLLNGN